MTNFYFKIGYRIKDKNKDITIIQKEIRPRYYKKYNKIKCYDKWYKYHCNKCGAELWRVESNIKKGYGCSCCSNQIVVKGINDIATTDNWMVKYFVNEDEIYKYTHGSGEVVLMKCPDCGYEKYDSIYNVFKYGFSCNKCGDGISYPEKVMFNFLKQLNIEFITQYSKINAKWVGKYKYDFYFELNGESYIIETHGSQHYKKGFSSYGGRTLKEEQQNDKDKYELAVNSGIKLENYIVIDCSYSEIDFIKENIINSRLSKIFDLNNIKWIDIEKYSRKSLTKQVCDYWHVHNEINNEGLTVTELGDIFYKDKNTIRNYLKIGNELNWCKYNPIIEKSNVSEKNGKRNKKSIEIFKDGMSLGIFESCVELSKQSEELFGVKLNKENISAVARGVRKKYKGFTFKYSELLSL